MIRFALTAACLVLSTVTLQAGGLDDLKAATAAVEKGNGDEAIRLFSQALAAGDLSPGAVATARKSRGSEYTAKSLIADAFLRRDEARRLRDSAIADFTAALGFQDDDAGLLIDRAQVQHLNGTYDQAIADFDAALKLNSTPLTLVQRAASRRGAGNYDGASADYSTALAANGKDSGVDAWDILSERGTNEFIAGRYASAAADFEKALMLGTPAHTGDVLWLPYQAAWLHIARARAGQNDAAELARNAEKIDLKMWPGTLIAFYLGQATAEQLSPPSSHGTMGHGRECNLSFFSGEQALIKNNNTEAARQFQRARQVCNIHAVQYLAAGVELKRMGK